MKWENDTFTLPPFGTEIDRVSHIFKEGELEVNSVRKESLLAAADGKKYWTKFYNLQHLNHKMSRRQNDVTPKSWTLIRH